MSDLPNELNAFAARLATLQPAPGPDRDRTLFEAGRRSAAHPRAWPLATLAVFCVALWLGVRPPTVVDRVVLVEQPVSMAVAMNPAPVNVAPIPNGDSYFQQRNAVVRLGVDALPHVATRVSSARQLNVRDFSAVSN